MLPTFPRRQLLVSSDVDDAAPLVTAEGRLAALMPYVVTGT